MSNSTTSFTIIADYSWHNLSLALVLAWREFLDGTRWDGYEVGYGGLDGCIARWTAEDLEWAEVSAVELKQLFEE